MKKLFLAGASIAMIGISGQAIAHCGACDEEDNHNTTIVDEKHASDKHMDSEPVALNIVETAAGNSDFSTLVAAVKAAGLVEALSGEGLFTVFAPTNEAFEKLPDGTVENLLKPENKEQLKSILTYHVVSGEIKASDISDGATAIETLQGTTLDVTKTESGLTVDGANVTTADLKTSNGVMHVIDTVVMP